MLKKRLMCRIITMVLPGIARTTVNFALGRDLRHDSTKDLAAGLQSMLPLLLVLFDKVRICNVMSALEANTEDL